MKSVRGVKRRRNEEEEDKEARLRRKLHHALRELRKVAKKVKTFEVQKTLKKLKDTRSKDPESDLARDLEAQAEILKRLDCEQLAHSALMTKLKKNKVLSADPLIPALSAELASNPMPPGTPGTLMAKVQSRILSSKVIASEVVLIMENLKTLLHPNVSVVSENTVEATHSSHSSLNIPKKRKTGGKRDASSSKEKPSGNGRHEDTSSDAMAETNDDWESGTVGGSSESDDSLNPRRSKERYSTGSADGYDGITFDSDSDNPAGHSKKPRQHEFKGQSEFLPSLSVGFTRGDSGSEFSDRETRSVDGNKRNRRGQRARRAIWEKKFGRNANHIKKKQEFRADRPWRRSTALDLRSGQRNTSSRRHPTPGRATDDHPRPRVSDERVNNSNWVRPGDRDLRRKDRPLHPSWEAKRKHKAASIVPAQGTKIVF